MKLISLKIEDDVHRRLRAESKRSGASLSAQVRFALERQAKALEARGGDLDARLDEILSTLLQTYVVLATSVGTRSPAVLEQAHAETKRVLIERGLHAPDDQ